MTISTKSRRYTLTDIEHLPRPWDDTRYEIIDGELHVSAQPSNRHQYVCTSLAFALSNWDTERKRGITLIAPGLIFAEDDNAAPDVTWASWQRYRTMLGPNDKLHGPPELVVEVLSPGSENEYRDREAKLKLYSRRGVDEYWIVDPEQRRAEVFRRGGVAKEALRLSGVFGEDDALESPLLPGFRVRVGDLFFPDEP